MKKVFFLFVILALMGSTLATNALAATLITATPTSSLGQLKVCKVAGSGVVEGRLFTFRVNGASYSVPAGPADRNGYCVLAGQYPLNTQLTIEEVIPNGYYVSRIEIKPDRAVSKNTAQGVVTVKIGSGVTEVIFTNRIIGSPTPTRTPTSVSTATPRPTRTPTNTPSCAPNCTPTPTPIPKGRLQICKEADGAGVTGYFTFRFETRSRSVPVGACAGLISVNAGQLTVAEVQQDGYQVTDIYTIPASRLISKDLSNGSAVVRIVEGTASLQTIVVFRNQKIASTPTLTPTSTSTPTPTSTGTMTATSTGTFTPTVTGTPPTFTSTPTSTPTGTLTPPVCQPTTFTADFTQFAPGASVEGMGAVVPGLNIDAKGTAIKLQEGIQPATFGAGNMNSILNGNLAGGDGFSDLATMAIKQPHLYTFTFDTGISVSNFSLRMLDFGDLDPTLPVAHYASMTAYDANGAVVSKHELSYDSPTPFMSTQYGNMFIAGDAINSQPGQPGNWIWRVSGSGIVRVVLEFGAGFDPNIGFDTLSFTPPCP